MQKRTSRIQVQRRPAPSPVKPATPKKQSARKRKHVSLTVRFSVFGTLLVAVLVFMLTFTPSFGKTAQGGIVLHGVDPEVEVYGPKLPENMVSGYSSVPADTVVVAEDDEAAAITYVYAAKNAKCYHLSKCKFAYASAQRLTIYEASMLGYKPCNLCDPPVYSKNAQITPEPEVTSVPDMTIPSVQDDNPWAVPAATDVPAANDVIAFDDDPEPEHDIDVIV